MERVDLVVVGAGLAGLSAAATAARSGARVLVFDSHLAGGRAQTDERQGYRFNRGPHALYESGLGMTVLRGLGIEPAGTRPPLGDAWVRANGRLHRAPLGPVGLLRTTALGLRSKARLGLVLRRITTTEPAAVAHLTARQFFDSLELAPDLDAMVCLLARLSSYCTSVEVVSADVVVGQITTSLRGVRYLHGGWARLVASLGDMVVANGGEIRTGDAVAAVGVDGAGPVVSTSGGVVGAAAVVIAAGLPTACSALLASVPAAWKRVAGPVTAACLDVGLAARPERGVVLGLDRADYAICHAPPAELAPDGGSVVHAMRYLPHDDQADAATLREELAELLESMGPGTVVTQRFARRLVVAGSTPTPDLGGLTGRPAMDSTGLDGVLVAGDWVGADGFLADAALSSGARAGAAAVALVGRRRVTP